MTFTGILQRRSAAAAASNPASTTSEVAKSAELPAPARIIRAVAYSPHIDLSAAAVADSRATTRIPVVPFDRSPTSEYPAFVPWVPTGAPPPYLARSFAPPAPPRAPFMLRIAVIVLLILAIGAVDVARTKPAWLPKHVVDSSVVAPSFGSGSGSPNSFKLARSSGSESVYTVPTHSFALSVSIDHPCWIMIKSLPDGKTLFTQTLEPANAVPPIKVAGNASLSVAARANAIVVTRANKVIGTIPNPAVGHTYIFEGSPTR